MLTVRKNVYVPEFFFVVLVYVWKPKGEDNVETIAIIDFETTGLSPDKGDRATEVAVVLVRNGKPIGRYQNLMNAGVRIPGKIQALTGITNDMIAAAPSASAVMREVCDFVEDFPLVAHNAAFDKRFWDAESARVRRPRRQEFACSMLIARRILPDAPSHRLGELAAFAELPATGRFHRAQADAEMAAQLLGHMEKVVQRNYRIRGIDHDFWCRVQRTPAAALHQLFANY